MKLAVVFVCATLCLGQTSGQGSGSDSTPAYLVLGKTNGDIWRCHFDAPTSCELFHKGNSTVTHTLLHDGHLYASHDDGAILKCDWYGNDSCQVFFRAGTNVNSLAVAGGYLYAGGGDNHLIRCRLNSSDCKVVHSFDCLSIEALYDIDKYIYVGTDRHLSRCLKGVEVDCTQIISTNGESITGISGWKRVIVATGHRNTQWNLDSESVKFKNIHNGLPNWAKVRMISNFKGLYLLVVGNDKKMAIIMRCEWDKAGDCPKYVSHDYTNSISFVYGTRMRHEQPSVAYNAVTEQKELMEVQVIDGKLCNASGLPADTGHEGRTFAMGPDGRLLLSSHSNLTSFFPFVSGAGEMAVEEGVVTRIVACSQHYRADVELNRQVVDELNSKGYVGDIKLEPCVDSTSGTATTETITTTTIVTGVNQQNIQTKQNTDAFTKFPLWIIVMLTILLIFILIIVGICIVSTP